MEISELSNQNLEQSLGTLGSTSSSSRKNDIVENRPRKRENFDTQQ